jgi:hypothetical protein
MSSSSCVLFPESATHKEKEKKKTKNCVKKADAAAAACLVTGEENG